MLNFGENTVLDKCHFVKGDWSEIISELASDSIKSPTSSITRPDKFDIVTGCDIIYETKHYPALVELISSLCKSEGKAIIASKAYYYGNGGSIAEFKDFINKDARFQYGLMLNVDTGMSNRREVFSVTKLG